MVLGGVWIMVNYIFIYIIIMKNGKNNFIGRKLIIVKDN